MLGRFSKLRALVPGIVIAIIALLVMFGVLAGRSAGFDAKTIVVEPAGGEALRITEYVDQDFGFRTKNGYQRIVFNDFGVPTDVEASSPDAPDDLTVDVFDDETRLRIGDTDNQVSGQHRYVLAYTLPDARLSQDGLALDIVGSGTDDETGRFEVVVTGMQLENQRCVIGPGRGGSAGECDLERDTTTEQPVYRAVLEPLPAGYGMTIYGDIVGFDTPAEITPPPLPDRHPDRRWLVALGVLAVGTAASYATYRWLRRRGRNEVFAGGAADAAFGDLPAPSATGDAYTTELVADDEMADLATIEFVPPAGVDPWQANVLLRERVDDDTVGAWFSGLAGREAIELSDDDDNLVIASGPRRAELSPTDAALLTGFLSLHDPYVTGEYDKGFASAWQRVAEHQREQIAESGWWTRPPTHVEISIGSLVKWFLIGALFLFVSFIAIVAGFVTGIAQSWVGALAVAAILPALATLVMYRILLSARTASGSALALRTESFRRFLEASESRHVEWAWSHQLIREYSGWAVALGEADAWNRALERADVPEPARIGASPVLIASMGASMHSAHTVPSSSGGGSGGFGGGGVGGGGGGGSSGSW